MPYGHTVISENLNGEKRPAWEFVGKFLDACTGHDRKARALLESKVEPLWDAAAPGRATRLAPAPPRPSAELVSTDLQAWVTTLRETALAQQTVASLQLSVSRHLSLVNGLTAVLNQFTMAAKTLTDERDALREELVLLHPAEGARDRGNHCDGEQPAEDVKPGRYRERCPGCR
jgi:hypothetical protein